MSTASEENINIFRISMPLKLRLCDFKHVSNGSNFFETGSFSCSGFVHASWYSEIIILYTLRFRFSFSWHTLSWMMCFRIKCEWTNHQNILTLTVLDAVDTTVTSFSLDLLAIAESIHGRCCKPQVAALFLRRSDRVKGCWKIHQFIHFFNYLWLSLW